MRLVAPLLLAALVLIPAHGASADDHTVTCADLDPLAGLGATLTESWPDQRFTAAVYDTRTGCEFHLNDTERITTASVVKIEIMAGVLLRAQDENRTLTTSEIDLLTPMIAESADSPASALWLSLGGTAGMAALDHRLGLDETVAADPWGATSTSAADQVWLIRQLLLGEEGTFTAESSQQARSFMDGVVSEQRWGISAGLPLGWEYALKNGFFPLTGRGWRINSVGLVDDPTGGGYVVAILSDGWATEAAGVDGVEHVARAINDHLAAESLALVWEGTFRDDDNSVHEGAIETLVEAGITDGCDEDLYCPSDPVTRAQMASFLMRAAGLAPQPPVTYIDTADSVHAGAIEALTGAGVARGCDAAGPRYCPSEPVTRGQTASLLVRLLELDPMLPSSFIDTAGSVHAGAIGALLKAEITEGCGGDPTLYCPNQALTRAQMASLLVRAFDLEEAP